MEDLFIGFAMYQFQMIPVEQFPDLAVAELEKGVDSPSLRILAGEKDPYQIHRFLEPTLNELYLHVPSKTESAIFLLKHYLEKMDRQEIDPLEGLKIMFGKIIKQTDFYFQSQKYTYDCIGFEHLYGYYDTYDDILNPLVLWPKEKHKQKEINKLKCLIYQEVRRLLDNFDSIMSAYI